MRFALILIVCLVSLGCATDPTADVAPRDAAPDLPDVVAETTSPAVPDTPPESPRTGEAATEPEVAPATAQFAPQPGDRLRYLGWLLDDHGHRLHLDVLDVVVAGPDGHRELRRTSRVGEVLGTWGEAMSEGYRLVRQDDAVLVGLLPDPYRDVPPPATVLRLPPVVGATWTIEPGDDAVHAEVTASETVETFVGTVPGAARVELRPDSEEWTETRWYGPTRGLLRVERRDAAGRRVLSLALAGADLPTTTRLDELLPR